VKSFAPEDFSFDVKKIPTTSDMKVADAEKAFVAAEKIGVSRRTTASAMVSANPDADAMQRTVADFRELALRADLVKWANNTLPGNSLKADGKEGKDLRVDDFDVAWRNPQVVNGLVQALDRSAGLVVAGSSELPEKSIEMALTAAEANHGVERTISAKQMASGPMASVALSAPVPSDETESDEKTKSTAKFAPPTPQQVHESKVAKYAEGLREAERERELLGWLNGRIGEFDCVADDFAASFRDPKLVCALVKSFVPDEVELARAGSTTEAKEKELAAAMEVGERICQVPRTPTASFMLTHPDARSMKQYVAAFRDFERKPKLLDWLNAKVAGVLLKLVENFDDDMRDGKVAVALVHAFLPDHVPEAKEVTEESKHACVELAFAAAEADLKIRALVSPQALTEKPDAVLVQKYIQCFMDEDEKVAYSDPQTEFGFGLGQMGEGARAWPRVGRNSAVEDHPMSFESRVELEAKIKETQKKADDALAGKRFQECEEHQKEMERLQALQSDYPTVVEFDEMIAEVQAEMDGAVKAKEFAKCAAIQANLDALAKRREKEAEAVAKLNDEAASKIQALARGRQARQKKEADAKADAEAKRKAEAATSIQALARGRQARQKLKASAAALAIAAALREKAEKAAAEREAYMNDAANHDDMTAAAAAAAAAAADALLLAESEGKPKLERQKTFLLRTNTGKKLKGAFGDDEAFDAERRAKMSKDDADHDALITWFSSPEHQLFEEADATYFEVSLASLDHLLYSCGGLEGAIEMVESFVAAGCRFYTFPALEDNVSRVHAGGPVFLAHKEWVAAMTAHVHSAAFTLMDKGITDDVTEDEIQAIMRAGKGLRPTLLILQRLESHGDTYTSFADLVEELTFAGKHTVDVTDKNREDVTEVLAYESEVLFVDSTKLEINRGELDDFISINFGARACMAALHRLCYVDDDKHRTFDTFHDMCQAVPHIHHPTVEQHRVLMKAVEQGHVVTDAATLTDGSMEEEDKWYILDDCLLVGGGSL
jgi:hypothetical protein